MPDHLSDGLKCTDGSKTKTIKGVRGLKDAPNAGGQESHLCTLILTEGESAKTVAERGLCATEFKYYGIYPLRGKFVNVRDASLKDLLSNTEIKNIKLVLGLKQGVCYDDVKNLRYGRVLLMTDQDSDGCHIKGLLINFFHRFWPELLKLEKSFLWEFITPYAKARRVDQTWTFYSTVDYNIWKKKQTEPWDATIYKVWLSISTDEEAIEYFSKDIYRKRFVWGGEDDKTAIEKAFSQKKIQARKTWLSESTPVSSRNWEEEQVTYSDFVDKQLINFFKDDTQRSIPSFVDGLKPAQRKALFCSLTWDTSVNKTQSVEELASRVTKYTIYHHRSQALHETIIRMCHKHVGSNNIVLLQSKGQFGSRAKGGKDSSVPQYLETRRCALACAIFPKSEQIELLQKNKAQKIEPLPLVPVIPIILVNGCCGIGSGWSTSVPNYNPSDIVENLRRKFRGDQIKEFKPWYMGFRGTIERHPKKDCYISTGLYSEVDSTTIRITELPIGIWTEDYKTMLEEATIRIEGEEVPLIQSIENNSSDIDIVDINVIMTSEMMKIAKKEGILNILKLTAPISTSNMHLFNAKKVLHRYKTAEEIFEDFYQTRLEDYERRKENNFGLEGLGEKVVEVEKQSATDLWEEDLVNFEKEYELYEREIKRVADVKAQAQIKAQEEANARKRQREERNSSEEENNSS